MDHSDNVRLHAIIHGRVQGVGFRAFVASHVQETDITGWVRNRWQGTVEVLAEGNRPSLDSLLRVLRRGPGPSNVTLVEHKWSDASGKFITFRTRMTA